MRALLPYRLGAELGSLPDRTGPGLARPLTQLALHYGTTTVVDGASCRPYPARIIEETLLFVFRWNPVSGKAITSVTSCQVGFWVSLYCGPAQ